jgi:hypothetical protein
MRRQIVQRLAIALCLASGAFAQRVPGRVGGSPNYPEINRSRPAPSSSVRVVTADQGFAEARSAYPGLKIEGYQRIQNFLQNLKASYGIDVTAKQVAEKLQKTAGNPKPAFKAILEEAHINPHEKKAKALIDESLK